MATIHTADQPNTQNGQPPVGGINLVDICFTLFRHKWIILAFMCLGAGGALFVRLVRPPIFVSRAQLMVHYVEARLAVPTTDGGHVLPPDPRGQDILSSEMVILKSTDVVTNVVEMVRPEKVLARMGGNDRLAAAGVVSGGIEVENPRQTSILSVAFRNPDSFLVQPVLQALIQAYMLKSSEIHRGGGQLDSYYARQAEELRDSLARIENDLKQIKTSNKLVSVEEAKRTLQTEIAKWQDTLRTAETELAEHKALLGNEASAALAGGTTNSVEPTADQINDYSYAVKQIEELKRTERDLLLRYTKDYPLVLTVRSQMEKLAQQKANLEKDFPALIRLATGTGRSGTNSPANDLGADLAEIRKLTARVAYVQTLLTNLQADATRVMELEPLISSLEGQRDIARTNLNFYSTALHQALVSQALGPGNSINMSIVQHPTLPARDTKKLMKLLMTVFGGCTGCGVALAFLIDLVLYRTIRRSADVERHLRLRVLLTVPDTSWRGSLILPWLEGISRRVTNHAKEIAGNGHSHGDSALAVWDPAHHLRTYAEGLRERLMTYFEVNNLGPKKPKLVALTACNKGSGVTTLAGGLAAALSKIGDGNVLLVDMNHEQGIAHSFHDGKPGCGLSEAPEPAGSELIRRSAGEESKADFDQALPSKFNHLLPQLKASDYDYIIFDMPPVSSVNATPRLASYMDIVLLVLESEKTGQQLATQATALMRESRANVAAVLNKYRPRVPARLSQEL